MKVLRQMKATTYTDLKNALEVCFGMAEAKEILEYLPFASGYRSAPPEKTLILEDTLNRSIDRWIADHMAGYEEPEGSDGYDIEYQAINNAWLEFDAYAVEDGLWMVIA